MRRKKVSRTRTWFSDTPQQTTIAPPPAAETPRQRFIQLLKEEAWRDLTEEEKKDLEALRLLIPVSERAVMVQGVVWEQLDPSPPKS